MAFGDSAISRINIGVGLIARPFVNGLNFVGKFLQTGMKKMTMQMGGFANTLKRLGTVTADKDSFLSPQWFASRARWFVQLRAFWTLWQSLSKAVAGAFEFEQEMANVRAITQATNDQFEALRSKALELGKTTRFSAAEAAQGMVVMAQAGLDTEEVIAAIEDVANLAVATLNDFQETASLVVTTMRAWKLPAEDAAYITDVFATSINRTKLNMDALANGFKFISGIAPQMNISIEETTALLGILANRGLSASVAATSLRSFMAALLSPTDKFARVLKRLGLDLDDVDPRLHSVGEILETLRGAGFTAADAFSAFRRRAASGAAILIGASKEFENLSERMYDQGRAAQQAAVQLDTVQGQAKQLNDTLIAIAADINRDTEPALKALARATKILAEGLAELIKPLSEVTSFVADRLDTTLKMFTRSGIFPQVEEFTKAVRENNAEMKTQVQNTVNAINKIRDLRTAVQQWRQAIYEGSGEFDSILRPGVVEQGLKILRNAKLLTDDEFKTLNNIEDVQEKRIRTEEIITQRLKEREAPLKAQWKIAQDTIKALEQATIRMALPGVSPAVYEVEKALKKVQETGASIADLRTGIGTKDLLSFVNPFAAARKIGQLAGEFSAGGSIRENIARTDAIRELRKNFEELNQVAALVGTNEVKLFEKHYPLVAKFVNAAREARGDFEKFVAVIQRSNEVKKEDIKLTDEENKKIDEQIDISGRVGSFLRDRTEERIKSAEARRKELAATIKQTEVELKYLQAQKDPIGRAREEAGLVAKINNLKAEDIDMERLIADLKDENLEIQLLQLRTKEKELIVTMTLEELQRRQLIVAERLANLQRQATARTNELEFINQLTDLRGAKETDLLRIERVKLEVQRQLQINSIQEYKNAGLTSVKTKEIKDHKIEIARLSGEIAIADEKMRLATDAVARNMASINANSLNFRDTEEFLNAEGGIIDTLFSIGQSGLNQALTDIANLWSEQREQAKGLKEELSGLQQEYQQALSEGNIERARQLELQMANLRGRIDDLNNPLKNLANTFRQFALSVVQELQKVIIKMLVLKLVSSVFGSYTGPYIPAAGSGGILEGSIKGFQRFANGGVTGGPGMAILGDNPSGKELVIPSENIKNNSVSGEVRDSRTPINIINVLTQEDVARAMAGAAGQKTIINTIGQDIGKRGPTFRAIHA